MQDIVGGVQGVSQLPLSVLLRLLLLEMICTGLPIRLASCVVVLNQPRATRSQYVWIKTPLPKRRG